MNSSDTPSDCLPAGDLFQTVYAELRKLAAHHLSTERAGHTLNPTALVHEAYLRLTKNTPDDAANWANRRHFFVSAANAMRQILVDHARYHRRQKRTGGNRRVDLPLEEIAASDQDDIVAINDAVDALAKVQEQSADLVKLRYFAGMTLDEAAEILEIAPSTADRRWKFAKAWLLERLSAENEP